MWVEGRRPRPGLGRFDSGPASAGAAARPLLPASVGWRTLAYLRCRGQREGGGGPLTEAHETKVAWKNDDGSWMRLA